MDVMYLFKQSMILVVMLSAPPLVVAVVVGVIVSLLQSVMQLQDQTLPFAIKLLAVGGTLAMSGRWVGVELLNLTETAFNMMATAGKV
ncbi:EscS/YscS/HrcS family type III secretion system export apparatus protein [Pantoea sp. Al-1710]|uniref:EscS/YscS/HrcS family type III secretion system export apparatus protein n=1 Tax=Candidatus Pantoea communis TaxID=2608354 RepID=A0ABX0RIB2_9GAMM|nr:MULTISPECIES: type III secretion system export apparatus subunit SctS [Pantoea]NIG12938.1 EscS/YscS/HrcS family type III secretion system export apparatus protein [Pantoea sp. Cy-640]NIG17361.1 EscS/YscS/HrcS family type III secretion system export apparatus protein [Pantoea communis]